MVVNASLSVRKPRLFQLSGGHRTVSPGRFSRSRFRAEAELGLTRARVCPTGDDPGVQGEFRGNPNLDHHHQHPDRNSDPRARHLSSLEGKPAFWMNRRTSFYKAESKKGILFYPTAMKVGGACTGGQTGS